MAAVMRPHKRARGKPSWSPEDGKWLQNERRRRGLTQEDLGAAIGRTAGRISEFERARTSHGPTGPSQQQLQAIKDALALILTVAESGSVRTTVEIDSELIGAAIRLSNVRTKKA